MAHKLVLRREGNRLAPQQQCWSDLLDEIPEGIDLNITATRARSIPQLGTYWGVLSFVVDNGPEWLSNNFPSKDELSDAIQLEVGFVRNIKLPHMQAGEYYRVPASKSFQECSQKRFNEYFESVQALLRKWCNFDAVEEYKKWMEARKRGEA